MFNLQNILRFCFFALISTNIAFAQFKIDGLSLATKKTLTFNAAESANPIESSKPNTEPNSDATPRKKWFAFWGWNRATYSNSDIHFKGADHDFTLYGVSASDRPTPLSDAPNSYLNPGGITLPQTNVRIGYFIRDDLAVSFALDHMKYVVDLDQTVPFSGYVNETNGINNVGTAANPVALNKKLSEDFLLFEHTDGLNAVGVELEKHYSKKWLGEGFPMTAFVTAGPSILYPRSNVKLLNRQRNDEFHVAGWGLGASIGLDIQAYKQFYIRAFLKHGYINLPDVLTSNQGDKASHSFTFNEAAILLGAYF